MIKNVMQYNFAIKVEHTDNIIITKHNVYLWRTTKELKII